MRTGNTTHKTVMNSVHAHLGCVFHSRHSGALIIGNISTSADYFTKTFPSALCFAFTYAADRQYPRTIFLRHDAGSAVLRLSTSWGGSKNVVERDHGGISVPPNADEWHYDGMFLPTCFPRLPREGLPQPLARFFYVADEQIADECLVPSRSTRGR